MPVRLFLCMSLIRWYKHAHMHTITQSHMHSESCLSSLFLFCLAFVLFTCLFVSFFNLSLIVFLTLFSMFFFLYLSPSLYWEACESSLSDILDVESGTEKGLPSQCWMSLHRRVLMLQTSLRGPNLKNTNAFIILAFSSCSRCCNNFFTQSSFPLHTPSWLYYKLNQEIKQFTKSANLQMSCNVKKQTKQKHCFRFLY